MNARSPMPAGGAALLQDHAAANDLDALRQDAVICKRCDLYRDATQLVFGEGPAGATVVLVGEQPGDKEDLAGRPFVGPAGHLLDLCLHEAGIDRSDCYVTNAVKHFKYLQRGKRRLHARPNIGEIQRCAWWLGAELELLRPKLVVALGATAATSLLGNKIRVLGDRGTIIPTINDLHVLVTIHPSALLRIRGDEERAESQALFIADLRKVPGFLKSLPQKT